MYSFFYYAILDFFLNNFNFVICLCKYLYCATDANFHLSNVQFHSSVTLKIPVRPGLCANIKYKKNLCVFVEHKYLRIYTTKNRNGYHEFVRNYHCIYCLYFERAHSDYYTKLYVACIYAIGRIVRYIYTFIYKTKCFILVIFFCIRNKPKVCYKLIIIDHVVEIYGEFSHYTYLLIVCHCKYFIHLILYVTKN